MVTGVIASVDSKDFRGTTYYSVTLEGSGKFYRTGKKKPEVKAGDKVEFNTNEYKGATYVDGDIKVTGWQEPKPDTRATSGGGGDREKYWQEKAVRDVANDLQRSWGAALNSAIALVELMSKAEALPMPAKKADRYEAVRDIIMNEAVAIFKKSQAIGQGEDPEAADGADPYADEPTGWEGDTDA